ncbi:MAG TPA: O-methyltransferase [Kofleriaceae bacterium]|nr:O-methyltransferase [Kofleriaceae bacterium]
MADKDSRAGSRYADEAILAYVHRVHAAHDPGLDAAFTSPDRDQMPAIQVGPSEGRLLELVLRLVGARRVVEVGTLAGYSAIRMARALPEEGRLWTIEVSPAHAEVARRNIAAAGLDARVEVLVGEASAVLPTLEQHGPFDAVFIDADKESYDSYGRWAARHLRQGGLLLGDNAYLFGRLVDDTPTAAAMRRFHEEAARAFDSVCIPTPDGLLLGIKK